VTGEGPAYFPDPDGPNARFLVSPVTLVLWSPSS
jgi:hypothetical protein